MCLIPMLKGGAGVAFAGCTGTITADVIRSAVIMYGMRGHPSVPPPQLRFEQIAGMFGSLSLAYNAGIVIPSLQRQHSDPSRIPRVVFATMGFISCLFLILASTAYSAVGCQITGNLLYSIYPDSSTGKDHIINDDRRSSKMSCISNADAENPYNGDFEAEAAEYRGANAFKYIVFRITMIVALVILSIVLKDHFSDMVNFVGASSITLISIVLPIVFFLRKLWHSIPMWEKAPALSVVVVCSLLGCYVMYTSGKALFAPSDSDTAFPYYDSEYENEIYYNNTAVHGMSA
ncbi:hypothetical protein BBJ29_009353 [Phytophthora kernoviae]|uniref:Amino acid transporter transmembrane domain-containing protein n=1 Tax=Phytophthora kernoviae TaxID=325452 RepID=A0A3F2REC7_9STRA|nr:hypothetical protein BBJ29_009353 [Phytophthora kernoviae]RLN54640.1 hypothetical protein BBP00_00008855 [Phytophthora kernoviae]